MFDHIYTYYMYISIQIIGKRMLIHNLRMQFFSSIVAIAHKTFKKI